MRSLAQVAADVLDNPIVERDSKSRAKSWRAPIGISVYLLLLSGFGYAMLSLAIQNAPNRAPDSVQMATAIFYVVAFQLALIVLAVPVVAAGQISGEQERGTLDMLLIGRMGPLAIVSGKLISSVWYVLILSIASLPLAAAGFLYAGLSLGQLVITQLLAIAAAVTIASVGLVCSIVFRRTSGATVGSYAVVLVLYVLSTFLVALPALSPDHRPQNFSDLSPILLGNPFFAQHSAVALEGRGTDAGRLLQLLFFQEGRPSRWGPALRPWQLSLFGQMVISGACVWTATRLLDRKRAAPAPADQKRAAPAWAEGATEQ